ncbi:hypothetical protein J6590_065783 [Homalodisca vitripennis]|nr:hypothetical protein J6590_065783 [Homalodisca vitripennis]
MTLGLRLLGTAITCHHVIAVEVENASSSTSGIQQAKMRTKKWYAKIITAQIITLCQVAVDKKYPLPRRSKRPMRPLGRMSLVWIQENY